MTPEEKTEILRINERCQSKDPVIDRLFWAYKAAGALPHILAHIDSLAAQIEALKEVLVEYKLMLLDSDGISDLTPEETEDMKRELESDAILNAAGVTWK